jgi:hypothetical protein
MKIGIDISQIVYEGTGVARFTEGLVKSILQYDKTNEWTFFMSTLRKKPNQELQSTIIHKTYHITTPFKTNHNPK